MKTNLILLTPVQSSSSKLSQVDIGTITADHPDISKSENHKEFLIYGK
jgi:hypothetical protein